jgi:hypothetical protein
MRVGGNFMKKASEHTVTHEEVMKAADAFLEFGTADANNDKKTLKRLAKEGATFSFGEESMIPVDDPRFLEPSLVTK